MAHQRADESRAARPEDDGGGLGVFHGSDADRPGRRLWLLLAVVALVLIAGLALLLSLGGSP